MKIHLVLGETGRYPGDSSTWIVKAFSNVDEAVVYAKNAEQEAQRILDNADGIFYEASESNKFDPRMLLIDGTATYSVLEVELD